MSGMDKLVPLAATAAGYYFGGPLAGAAAGLGASALTGGLTPDKPGSAAPAPSVTPPVPMPDPKGSKDAKRRTLAEMMKRQGRASTILSDTSQSDALGG